MVVAVPIREVCGTTVGVWTKLRGSAAWPAGGGKDAQYLQDKGFPDSPQPPSGCGRVLRRARHCRSRPDLSHARRVGAHPGCAPRGSHLFSTGFVWREWRIGDAGAQPDAGAGLLREAVLRKTRTGPAGHTLVGVLYVRKEMAAES
jgi:hypothetical protein